MKPGPSKIASKLSDSTTHLLNMYALAAGTAGAGMLALAQPVEAKIIYTHANITITTGTSHELDLNHDGIADFTLGVYFLQSTFLAHKRPSSGAITVARMYVNALQESNAEVVGNRGFARAFRPDITIGSKQIFGKGEAIMAKCQEAGYVSRTPSFTYTSTGPWLNARNRYLGLRFKIDGKIHYGWARLTAVTPSVDCGSYKLTLTGYAYESIPNKHIVTGKTKGLNEAAPTASLNTPTHKPATLGRLALGAPALSIWRRKESVAATPESN